MKKRANKPEGKRLTGVAAGLVMQGVEMPPVEAFDGLPEGKMVMRTPDGVMTGAKVGTMQRVRRSGGRRARDSGGAVADELGADGLPLGSAAAPTPRIAGRVPTLPFLRRDTSAARMEAMQIIEELANNWQAVTEDLQRALGITADVIARAEKNAELMRALQAEGLEVHELTRMQREGADVLRAWEESKA